MCPELSLARDLRLFSGHWIDGFVRNSVSLLYTTRKEVTHENPKIRYGRCSPGAARRLRRHLEGKLTAVIGRIINGPAEAINTGIEKIKHRANDFRNRERFRAATPFRLGCLDL